MRKIHTGFLLLILLFNFSSVRSQINSTSTFTRFKLYINGFYHNETGPDRDIFPEDEIEHFFEKKVYDFNNLSIALEMNSGKFITHEFELMPLGVEKNDEVHYMLYTPDSISRVTDGGVTTTIQSAFRYEARHYFVSDKTVLPYLALSSQLFYDYSKYEPAISIAFAEREHCIGLLFSLIPGFCININRKLAIDINMPLGIYDVRFTGTKNENPLLPVGDIKKPGFESNIIPEFVHVRIGIAYTIK
jgi:hypothetical protein